MIDAPQITQSPARLTAVIHVIVPREEMQSVMGPGIEELMATVAGQGITPTGPWFTHHLRMDPKIFDFEIGLPVSQPIAATGRVVPGQLPATKVARTVFHGGYEGLGEAWGEFDAWIRAQGHTPGPNLWECYVTGPESSSDPAQWRTELNRPLKEVS
jgi:effector-binding domain-containing protein